MSHVINLAFVLCYLWTKTVPLGLNINQVAYLPRDYDVTCSNIANEFVTFRFNLQSSENTVLSAVLNHAFWELNLQLFFMPAMKFR